MLSAPVVFFLENSSFQMLSIKAEINNLSIKMQFKREIVSFTALTLSCSPSTFDVNLIGFDVKQIKLMSYVWNVTFNVFFI